MNVFIVKGNWILAFFLSLLAIFSAFLGAKTAEVFKSGDRSLPIYSVSRDDNKASITFNCAWNDDDVDSILSTLSDYNIKSTFFIVGNWAEKYPESLKKIIDAGHEIGGHSYNHKDYTRLSKDEIKEDLDRCDTAIKNASGTLPVIYRVPSGAYNNNAIDSLTSYGKIPIQWSCDSIDYNDASCDAIYNRSIKLTPGGILLMHNGTKNTAKTLSRILDNLTKRFELVAVSELLYSDNFKIDPSGCMHLEN